MGMDGTVQPPVRHRGLLNHPDGRKCYVSESTTGR
jgi:hypothetical protein